MFLILMKFNLSIILFFNVFLAWDTITTYHKLGDLNNRNVFLIVSEIKIPRPQCLHHQVLVGSLILAYIQLLPSLCVVTKSSLCKCLEREPALQCFFFKDTNLIMKVSSSWAHLNLITSLKPHLQIPSYWG